MKSRRRRAREAALKILYANNINSGEKDLNFEQILREDKIEDAEIKDFVTFLITFTENNIEKIDEYIIKVAQKWDFGRIAVLDKCVLRMAVCELLYSNLDYKIVLNEAIELAKEFGSESSGKFVNGILHNVSVYIDEQKK